MPTSSVLSSATGEQPIFYPEIAECVWIVRYGQVDLFYQKMVDGEYGARHHIATIRAGQVLFGIDLQQHGGLSLVAVQHPETLVERLSKAVFRRRNTLSDRYSPSLLLEGWVHALSEALNLGAPPRNTFTVSSGARFEATENLSTVTPEEMLCWVSLRSGEGLFLGYRKVTSNDSPIPLSRRGQTWLELNLGSSLEACNFVQIDAIDPGWKWLDSFHATVIAGLLRKLGEEQGRWTASLAQQQASDALVTHQALKSLARPLAGASKDVEPLGMHKDPLLAACKALEYSLGIDFKPAATIGGNASFRYSVEAIAHASAVRQRRVALRGDWWKEDCGSLLAMRKDDKRPVALLFRPSGHYDCFDPVESGWKRVDATLALTLNPAAYMFYRRFPLRTLGGKELTRLILGASSRDLLRVLVMGGVGGILSLAFPITVGIIFDSVIPSAERGRLLGLAVLLIVVAIAGASFTLVRSLATLRVEARIDAVGQSAIWDRLLRLPAPFFRRFSSGDLAIRSLAINQIRMILTNSTLSALLSGVFSLFNLALLFFLSVKLAELAVAMTVCYLLAATVAALIQLRYTRQAAKLRGRISSTLLEFMNGISKLRVSGSEQRAFGVWAHLFSQQKQLYFKSRSVAIRLFVVRSVYPLVAVGILFAVASPSPARHGTNTLGTGAFLAFLSAFMQFITCSVQFTSVFPSVISIIPVFERVLPILQTAPEVEEGRSSPGEMRGGLQVSHLTFRYDAGSSPILRDVSFDVRPGEFVAFTGPSGSGKSTLLRLILGFETPESGNISYDDQDIRGLDVQALRRQIGVVLQSGRLVSGTILDNIIGSLPLTHDDAWEAASMAGFDRDVKSMPMGMHTFINDGGSGLSGGQRQRLMIARAIIGKPRMLFFDEATSALDNYTQSVVSRSLETLRATRIVIAHRLSTIQQADRIYVFDHGSIVQTGTYRELSRTPGLFQTLVQRQIV